LKVTLSMRIPKNPPIPVEAEMIIPQSFYQGISIELYEGNKKRGLEEIFDVTIEGEADSPDEVEIVLCGDTGRLKRVGQKMGSGKITIFGDAGMHFGNFMSGGTITIHGNAGSWLGSGMTGGLITCHGDASHFCGAAYRIGCKGMEGGKIEVYRNSGDFTAGYLSGGTIHIHGRSGDLSGVGLRSGELLIDGDSERVCGGMTGGRCIVSGRVYDMLPTFEKKGTVRIGGKKFCRFEGDMANNGKGELVVSSFFNY